MSLVEGVYINHISSGINDGFTTLSHISIEYQSAMAFVNLDDHLSIYAVIRADGEGVPILFPLGSDGVVVVTAFHLGLWF
jgi:hypothetical protein